MGTFAVELRETTEYGEPGKWSAWADADDDLAVAALNVLVYSGEVFGVLTVRDAVGVEVEQLRVDPMVRAYIAEHYEAENVAIARLSDERRGGQ